MGTINQVQQPLWSSNDVQFERAEPDAVRANVLNLQAGIDASLRLAHALGGEMTNTSPLEAWQGPNFTRTGLDRLSDICLEETLERMTYDMLGQALVGGAGVTSTSTVVECDAVVGGGVGGGEAAGALAAAGRNPHKRARTGPTWAGSPAGLHEQQRLLPTTFFEGESVESMDLPPPTTKAQLGWTGHANFQPLPSSPFHHHTAAFLKDWWVRYIGGDVVTTDWTTLRRRLTEALPQACLDACDNEVLQKAETGCRLRLHRFLDGVLLPLLLTSCNKHTEITLKSLHLMQVAAEDSARRRNKSLPSCLEDMLLELAAAADPHQLQSAAHERLPVLEDDLLVPGMRLSYQLEVLKGNFLAGTRAWLLEQVVGWINQPDQRMLLLLAPPGLGKSTLAAELTHVCPQSIMAVHFFKAGEDRAQGRAMVLSLLAQLASRLPAIEVQLRQQLKRLSEEKDPPLQLKNMTMDECFNMLLVPVLNAVQHCDTTKPSVVVLLDAINEAENTGESWARVASMLSDSLKKLPRWFRLVALSRPEVEHAFADPVNHIEVIRIQPDEPSNRDDVHRIARHHLQDTVAPQDLGAAVDVLAQKSEYVLLYMKYAVKELDSRTQLSLAELQELLPSGMGRTYASILRRVYEALDQPEALALRSRVLPVLAVAQEPLSVADLAWLTGISTQVAQKIVGTLLNIFPIATNGRIHPYRKTVIDFLLEPAVTKQAPALLLGGPAHTLVQEGSWSVDAKAGHLMFAGALLKQLESITTPAHWRDPCVVQMPECTSYSLRHCVTHLIGAAAWDDLHNLMCNSPVALKAMVEHGMVPDLVHQLLADTPSSKSARAAMRAALGPERDAQVHSVAGFLQADQHELRTSPHSFFPDAWSSPTSCALNPALRTLALPDDFWKGSVRLAHIPPTLPPAAGRQAEWYGGIVSCALTPDDRILVSGSDDGSLLVWLRDGHTGAWRLSKELKGHSGGVKTCVISPANGQQLVSAFDDGTLAVWHLGSGSRQAILEGHSGQVWACAISSDGRTLVSGAEDGRLLVWDLASGKQARELLGHDGVVWGCAITPDCQTLVSASSDMCLIVWDLASGEQTAKLREHTDWVLTCAISPTNGNTLVSASRDADLLLWDLADTSLPPRRLQGHSEAIWACAISSDGAQLVSGSTDGKVLLWDLGTMEKLATLQGHLRWVSCCAFSRDRRYVISGSEDGSLLAWDLTSLVGDGAMLPALDDQFLLGSWRASPLSCPASPMDDDAVPSLMGAMTPDSSGMSGWTQDASTLLLASAASGQAHPSPDCVVLQKSSAMMLQLAIGGLPGCQSMVCGSKNGLTVRDLSGGQIGQPIQVDRDACPRPVLACAISPDGNTLASGYQNGDLTIWGLVSGQWQRTLLQKLHTDVVWTCTFSPDSKTLVSGSWDTTLALWDCDSWKMRRQLRGHSGKVSTCSISSDGRTMVSGSFDGTLLVWALSYYSDPSSAAGDQQPCRTLPYAGKVWSSAMSPDGRVLASGAMDGSVTVWDLATCTQRSRLVGHSLAVNTCAISPDGRTLVSGSWDRTLRVWDLTTGQLVAVLEGHSRLVSTCAIFICDGGARLVSGSGDGNILVWDLDTAAGSGGGIYCIGAKSLMRDWAAMQGVSPLCLD